jgi:pimeloyl-CoA dehydrogenase small subunit
MDFDLSDEQRLLKDSVERFVADRYDFERRKAFVAEEGGYARENWAQFAELGLLAVPFSEEDGGIGGGPVETMIVQEAFGRGLVVEPYLATVVLGGGVLRHAGSAEQKAELIAQIAGGETTLALAHVERGSRYDLHHVETRARRDGDAWVIDGEKGVVLNGDSADKLIVVARTAGGTRDRDGIGLFLVDGKAPGVSRRGYPTQDGGRAAEIGFENVKTEGVLGDPAAGLPVLERVVDEAIAALCAEAIGVMDRMREITVDYIKQRKQFGVPIGTFQALQHRAADMVVAIEQARSMAFYATMMAAEDNAAERAKAISAAKVQVCRSGRFVGQQAIQLHGGIGMTMEYNVGHFFKRMTVIETLFGDADHHLARVAAGGSLFEAA